MSQPGKKQFCKDGEAPAEGQCSAQDGSELSALTCSELSMLGYHPFPPSLHLAGTPISQIWGQLQEQE